MVRSARLVSLICIAAVFIVTSVGKVHAQSRALVPGKDQIAIKAPSPSANPARAQNSGEPAGPNDGARRRPNAVMSAITLADIGFGSGFRFANLGGRREVFVPLPQGADIMANDLVLVVDDISAHDARRSLEILINDRSVAAIALDGRSNGRTVRIPLGHAKARDGFLKFSFFYSGAATQDRCIDVRYVGDSLTVRPETAVEIEIAFAATPDVATTVALMPRNVTVTLPRRRLEPSDIAAALAVARSLAASGRRVGFHQGYELLSELARRGNERSWARGLVIVGSLQEILGHLDSPVATIAGPTPALGELLAARIGGLPVLVVSDAGAVRASRLLASPTLNATRGLAATLVGEVAKPKQSSAEISFEQLGLILPRADVFGRADLPVTIDTRALPAATKAARLMLDVMVAPDGAGEKAVVSAFVNERLVDSLVAAADRPTRLDFPLADGLVGTTASIRTVVQRRSAQGDCRFVPQGYPAEILGSSAVVLEKAEAKAHDFFDLIPHWASGIEILIPTTTAERPLPALHVLAGVLDALSTPSATLTVKFVSAGSVPAPASPFIAVSALPPAASTPRVRFDRGRVVVADRSGQTLIDLGGFSTGAVAQVVQAGAGPGLWITPLAADGSLPTPATLRLDRGDVAFIDKAGVALAMSTERDTLIRITYPDQVSWVTVADRFRTWIIGSLWVFATIAFLFALQQMFRRRPMKVGD